MSDPLDNLFSGIWKEEPKTKLPKKLRHKRFRSAAIFDTGLNQRTNKGSGIPINWKDEKRVKA